MTPEVTLHGAGLVAPFSKPALPSNCCVVPPLPDTVKAIVIECVVPAPAPATEMLYVPATVEAPTEIVRVDDPTPGAPIDDALKLAVAPAGRPDGESAIEELKLPEIVVVIVDMPELPCGIVRVDAEADNAKSPLTGIVAYSAKSSTTKEVLNFEFSTPIK